MNWQQTPFTIPLILSALACLGTALYLRVRRPDTIRTRIVILLLLAAGIWMLGAALEGASTQLQAKILWDKVQLVGICFIPGAWLAYTLQFTGRERYLTTRTWLLLNIFPLLVVLLAITNEAHGLIWSNTWLDSSASPAIKRTIYGPALWALVAYAYALLFAGVVILVQGLVRYGRLKRWQASALLIAVMAPWVVNALEHTSGWAFRADVKLAPIAFAMTVPIVAWLFSRLRVRDIVPVARDRTVENMDDALLVLDGEGRIIDLNLAARALFPHFEPGSPDGTGATLWPGYADWAKELQEGKLVSQELELERDGAQHVYDLRISPILDWRGRVVSRVIVLRDVSPRADAQRQVQASLREKEILLDTISGLTSSLQLGQVLLDLSDQLLRLGAFQICSVYEWEREREQFLRLAEHTRAVWTQGIKVYQVADYPSTAEVLETGKWKIVHVDDNDPEKRWLAETGLSSTLLLPLQVGDETAGLIEISCSRHHTLDEQGIAQCESVVHEAAPSLISPLEANPEDALLGLAQSLTMVSGASTCAISQWSKETAEVATIAEYSELIWDSAQGPTYHLSDWPKSTQPLMLGQAMVTRLSDEQGDSRVQLEMAKWGGRTQVTMPISIKGETIGLVELDDIRKEREVTKKELRLWQALVDQAAIAIENARLHAEVRAQLATQTTLREALSAISSALDSSTVLSRVAEQMGRAVNATSSYISSYEPESKVSTVLAEWIGPEACEAEQESDLGRVHLEDEDDWLELMLSDQPQAVSFAKSNLADFDRSHMLEYGASAILYIPLRVKDHLLGYVEIWESRRQREFDPQELALCQDIARHAAVAIENAMLYEQAQTEIAERTEIESLLIQRNRELLSLQAAATATTSSLDPRFVLETVTWEMTNLLEVDGCTLWEWNSGNAHKAKRNGSVPIGWLEASSSSERFDLADYPIRHQVLHDRAVQQLTIGQRDLDPAESAYMQRSGIQSLLLLPLAFHDRVLGLVQVTDGLAQRQFTDREVSLAEMLASQAATAIQNAELYEQAQREIVVRRQAEETLEGYAAELERSNQELQQFAHIASHDLQEPLRMVTSYLQLLERRYKGQLDPDADDFIHFAVDGASRMRDLLKGLLAYSRVGTEGVPFEPVDSRMILEQVLDNLQLAILDSGAEVSYDQLPTVMADPTQLGQLFQNLVSNALKFQRDSVPEIQVEAKELQGEWLFWVRDNGIGIESQYAGRIFVIFQRLHTRDEYPGTGIGLSVCRRIIERHGGRIWFESTPGEGTTFYFTLPQRS